MLWCAGAQNIGLSNVNLGKINVWYDHNARQSKTDGQASWQYRTDSF